MFLWPQGVGCLLSALQAARPAGESHLEAAESQMSAMDLQQNFTVFKQLEQICGSIFIYLAHG